MVTFHTSIKKMRIIFSEDHPLLNGEGFVINVESSQNVTNEVE